MLDTDKSGEVSALELETAVLKNTGNIIGILANSGIHPTEMAWLFHILDKDGSGDISETEFIDGIQAMQASEHARGVLVCQSSVLKVIHGAVGDQLNKRLRRLWDGIRKLRREVGGRPASFTGREGDGGTISGEIKDGRRACENRVFGFGRVCDEHDPCHEGGESSSGNRNGVPRPRRSITAWAEEGEEGAVPNDADFEWWKVDGGGAGGAAARGDHDDPQKLHASTEEDRDQSLPPTRIPSAATDTDACDTAFSLIYEAEKTLDELSVNVAVAQNAASQLLADEDELVQSSSARTGDAGEADSCAERASSKSTVASTEEQQSSTSGEENLDKSSEFDRELNMVVQKRLQHALTQLRAARGLC